MLSMRGGTKTFTMRSMVWIYFHKFVTRSFGCVMRGQASGTNLEASVVECLVNLGRRSGTDWKLVVFGLVWSTAA